jgi:glyoxylase-like metal-dependent hydrolase (beta-lactamase superfamily II)
MENSVKPLNLRISSYEVCAIPTGIFGLDGGAMFGTVPKVLWEKSNPPDERNRIPMEARGLLLKSAERNILIDCGNGGDFIPKYGQKLGAKFSELYNVNDEGPSLTSSLKKHGLSPDDVTDVILTHLHFDHSGGATRARAGQLVPTFPKAKYYVQKTNLETARHPNLREKASYLPANFEPLLQAGVLELLEGDQENLLPGVSVVVSNGHTLGQQIVKVSDDKNGLVYCADLVPTSSHVRLPWIMGYDLNPLLMLEEKAKVLGPVADQSWFLFFEHDPYCNAATVSRSGSDFQIRERFLIQ